MHYYKATSKSKKKFTMIVNFFLFSDFNSYYSCTDCLPETLPVFIIPSY
jgi:hypothetical protein